jgi:hypothetical protein
MNPDIDYIIDELVATLKEKINDTNYDDDGRISIDNDDINDDIHLIIDNYVSCNSINDNKTTIIYYKQDVFIALKSCNNEYGDIDITNCSIAGFYAKLAFHCLYEYVNDNIDDVIEKVNDRLNEELIAGL